MQSLRKYLPYALFLAFFSAAFIAFMQGRPTPKNARVYKAVQAYSPYYLDKRFGGLQILSKEDKKFKEKPNNATLFQEFERLEKEWAKTHLKFQNNTLVILNNTHKKVSQLRLKTPEEIAFVHRYYGL
ncbi:MAG: hypothetical protein DSZ12_05580 [Sulfurovum sp.]|nr:MAG: hypothetical protein DSZ12_05580 [Sulfurovum sp.]